MQTFLKWILLIFTLQAHHSVAQKKIKLTQLSTENGLSQNTINSIFQDKQGFMWFGTHNGLNLYDAYSFKVFNNLDSDPLSIVGNDIYSIMEDQQGNLWIGTSLGLSLFNRNTYSFKNYDHSPDENYTLHPVWSICPSKTNKDELWLGASGGVFLFNKVTEKFTHFKINDSIQNANSTGNVLQDSKGNIWVSTLSGGLWTLDIRNKKFTKCKNDYQKDHEVVRALIEDSKGNIWIGNDEGILSSYSYKSNQYNYYDELKGRFSIRSILEDKKGNLWIGTDKGGVYIFDHRKNSLFPLEYEKENGNDVIRSMHQDRKGNIWLGTYSGGVFLYDNLDASFNYLIPYSTVKNENENNSVLSILEDKSKTLWVGTDGGGLIEFKNGLKVNSYRKQQDGKGISGNIILCIADSREKLFLGTYSTGLSILEKRSGKFQNFLHDPKITNSLSDNSIWTIYTEQDHLWIGTNIGGLNLFYPKKGTFKHFTNNLKNPKSISSNTIRSIFKDSKGKLWIGTVSGLNLLNEKDSTFFRFSHDPKNKQSISNNNVLSIYEDSRHNLWLGTHGGGINKLDRETHHFTAYNEEKGLLGSIVYGIVEDEKGNLWLSTNKGVYRFNPEKEEFKIFNISNGLSNSQFNIGAHFKNEEGEVYFGTTSGVCSFFPSQIKINTFPPPLVLTDFLLFNKSVDIGPGTPLNQSISQTNRIILDHTQTVFSFSFSALNYNHPEKNQYAYKLEGFDKDWNYIGNQRTATYTNLEAGKYQFKVRGSNSDNVWNNDPATIQVIITPPFWKTNWFRIFSAVLTFLIVYLAYRLKVRNIQRQKEILEELVTKKTNEIEEKNKLIYEKERQNAQLLQQKLSQELTNKSMELSNYILLIIQKNQLLDELKKKVKETIKSFSSGKPQDLRKLLTTINLNFSPQQEWSDFNLNFTLIHNGFAQSLKSRYPDLTTYDLRLCALYKIDISSKQISEVMGISLATLKMARYRLRKKLNLSPDEDLTDFLRKM